MLEEVELLSLACASRSQKAEFIIETATKKKGAEEEGGRGIYAAGWHGVLSQRAEQKEEEKMSNHREIIQKKVLP